MPLISTDCVQGRHQRPPSSTETGPRQCPQFATYEMVEYEPGRIAPANPTECECPCHAEYAARVRLDGEQRAKQIYARAGLMAGNLPAGLWSDDEQISRSPG